jgi:catechol 2,3-dioxygenase-like lactoylglutathione lyase family enzyme
MMNTPLRRVIIFVQDVQACAQFYVDIFGFTRIEADDPPSWQELETGGCRLAFHKVRGFDGPTGSEDHPHKIVFFTDDVASMRSRAIAHGAEMGKVKTFGALTMCDGRDIEGHVFQLSNRR